MTKNCDCGLPEAFGKRCLVCPSPSPAPPTAEEERDALVRALRNVLMALHPVYPSTAGPHGGIGGAAMTPWCHVNNPYTDEHNRLLTNAEDTLRAAYQNAEREGRTL